MQIKNPTENALDVQVKGVKYHIEAEGTLNNIPEEVARYWQENIHKFIQIQKDKLEAEVSVPVIDVSKVKEPVIEASLEEKEEETEEVKEEEVPVVKASKIKKVK